MKMKLPKIYWPFTLNNKESVTHLFMFVPLRCWYELCLAVRKWWAVWKTHLKMSSCHQVVSTIKKVTWGHGGRTRRWKRSVRELSVWWISTAAILLMENMSMVNRRLEKTSLTMEDWRLHTMLVYNILSKQNIQFCGFIYNLTNRT